MTVAVDDYCLSISSNFWPYSDCVFSQHRDFCFRYFHELKAALHQFHIKVIMQVDDCVHCDRFAANLSRQKSIRRKTIPAANVHSIWAISG